MEYATLAGNYYTITSKSGCTVTDATGTLNETVDAGKQLTVQAPSDKLIYDDEQAIIFKATFKYALAALGLLGGGDKLSNYEVVEYFETDGTNYLDTGINGYAFRRYEIKFSADTSDYENRSYTIFGLTDDLMGNSGVYMTFAKVGVGLRFWYNRILERAKCEVESALHTWEITYGTSRLKIDGVEVVMNNYGGDSTPRNPSNLTFWLGGNHHHYNGKIYFQNPTACKFYSWKLWDELDRLMADLIPVRRKKDGYPGMWCKVRKLFLPMQYATNATYLDDEDWEQLKALESGGAGVGSMAL